MKKTVGCLLILLLAGCAGKFSEYPEAKSYPHSTQQKLQAAYHWKVLAANEAELISSKLPPSGIVYLACTASKCNGKSKGSSIFDNTYRDLLTSEMVNRGIKISVSESGADHKLAVNVNTVEHIDRNSLPPKAGYRTGVLSFLAGLGTSANNWSEPALALIPLSAASDLHQYWADRADESITEVIITTQVTSNDQIVSSNSSIYYFNSNDFDHYQSQTRLSVTGNR
ncbi:hypothetical protein [uncultured Porticoccus sp.]|jgi:hypothetical protein|uniref:hypothetical protein n=1 Tax=uncultured Porticoccus sp. TaxID=1256050 RepID=UPI000C0DA0EA|nr:MAG: hypothetical protein COA29_02385 [Porticoccus sp.]|tara:strand:- start:4093 stop:4770 length:678 start_codon:yes stop_codon:yes gene_type:complete